MRNSILAGALAVGLGATRLLEAQDTRDVRPFLAALSVSSVQRTSAWYRDHFGFRILRLDTLARPGLAAALLERDGFYLEVVAVAGSRPRVEALVDPRSNGSLQGLYKLGLWVRDADSVAHALARAGIGLYRPLASDSSLAGGTRYFLVRDPDSTVVQVFGPLRPRG